VVVHPGTRIGKNVRIDDHAVVGKQPMKNRRSAMTTDDPYPPAIIENDVQIGTSAIVYAGCVIGSHTLVADLATVREDVHIGQGTIVGRGVAIENQCEIGANCKLETNVYVTAKTRIEDNVFIAPGVLTSNDNYLGRTQERFEHFGGPILKTASRIGIGAVILPGMVVESEAVLAAGAVLTTDAQAGTIYVGIPARPAGPVPPEQLLDG
jgi:UDP-3-O-[3-hydroxymyristoyl] glucosamine N-acyltransferase